MQPRIVCVLKTGGDFAADHAWALRERCARFAPGARFTALTDDPALLPAKWAVPLKHGWPGWWSKIEVFRFRGPVLYLDLDTVPVASLTRVLAVARETPFMALADFDPRMGRGMQSAVMSWSGRMRRVYEAFAAAPERHMSLNRDRRWWGDQGFIERRVKRIAHLQTLLPGVAVSWKLDMRGQGPAPDGALLVCFHGKPRPWEVDHGL